MGYTHKWKRKKELDQETFEKFSEDVKKILQFVQGDLGILLADGLGTPGTQPVVDTDEINFNGADNQPIGAWTTTERVSIPWPSETASVDEFKADPIAEKVVGKWYAGDTLSQRTAPVSEETGLGLGSYETLFIERILEPPAFLTPDENGRYFSFCKTAYRPYDIAVTAVLISFKHHFGESVVMDSDGSGKDWMDGRMVCQNLLGYGLLEGVE